MSQYEVSAADYGRMMFEMMLGDPKGMPEHWASIKKEATPLVQQLLALNQKMKNGGYKIHGYKIKGKKVLSDHQRIDAARIAKLEVEAKTLKKGDLIWLHQDYDCPMENFDEGPIPVHFKKGNGIYVDHPYHGRHDTYVISATEKVLKAPKDYEEKEEQYISNEYWLAVADELGI